MLAQIPVCRSHHDNRQGANGDEVLGADQRQANRESVLQARDRLLLRLAPRTVNTDVFAAGHCWEWGRSRGLVDQPWPDPGRLQEPETRCRACTEEETSRMLDGFRAYAGGRYYPIILPIADAGSRSTETLHLRERDLDRVRSLVTFRVGHTKRKSRTVFMSPQVIAIISSAPTPDGLLFPRKSGGPHNHKQVSAAWKIVAKRAGVPTDLTPHSLRNTWIMDSLSKDVPPKQSMDHTGHRSTRVHLGYARNAPNRHMREAAKTIRRSRPPLPHTTPTVNGGGTPVTREERRPQGQGRSTGGSGDACGCATSGHGTVKTVCSSATDRLCDDSPQGTPLTPTERDCSWETLTHLAAVGGDLRGALRRLALDRELQRRLRAHLAE